jgi:uncharacterized membrane protein YeaQ/YmgE (transglycosylase-associated protein family)
MSLISLILVLAVIGLLAWAITTFVPMPGNIKTLIIVVCGIVALLYVLSAFGVIPALSGVRVPTVSN